MKIHEYQAKQLLRQGGIPVAGGSPAFSVAEAQTIADTMDSNSVVLKSQIHAGGRGAGRFTGGNPDKGGIRIISDKSTIEVEAAEMLGATLVTSKTSPQGQQVRCLYIEEKIDIATELSVAILLDRAAGRLLMVASNTGGLDVENLTKVNPDTMISRHVSVAGLTGEDTKFIIDGLGIPSHLRDKMQDVLGKFYDLYIQSDGDVFAINPLVITKDDSIVALNASLSFDPNGLARQPHILELKDETESEPIELEASKKGLLYIKLDGDIGCLVNGAGLSMATIDTIDIKGGKPANFIDTGGAVTAETVATAFDVILANSDVNGILVNIFGGIVRCDFIANGIIDAVKQVNLSVPLVVRLEGTNVEQGRKILMDSNVNLVLADDLEDATEKMISMIKGA